MTPNEKLLLDALERLLKAHDMSSGDPDKMAMFLAALANARNVVSKVSGK